MLSVPADKMHSFAALRIWVFLLPFMLSLPKRRGKKESFHFGQYSVRICLSLRNKEHWRRKWFVDLTSFPHMKNFT